MTEQFYLTASTKQLRAGRTLTGFPFIAPTARRRHQQTCRRGWLIPVPAQDLLPAQSSTARGRARVSQQTIPSLALLISPSSKRVIFLFQRSHGRHQDPIFLHTVVCCGYASRDRKVLAI
jgi:hypothetical protein